jgi:signal transduction histidine kinase
MRAISKLVFVLLIASPVAGWSQSTFADSLRSIADEGSDSLRLERLVTVFNKYTSQNYDRARITGNLLMPLMRKVGTTQRLADFLMRMGQTEYTFGNHDEALRLYMESAELFQKIGQPGREASLYNEIAVLHRKNKNMERSKEYVNAALTLYKIAYDTNGMATTLNNLGITHEIEGHLDSALYYYRTALGLYGQYECELCVSYCQDYMAGVFRLQNQFDSAFYYEAKSLEMRRKLKNTYAEAQSLMTMGEIYFEQAKFRDAITYFNECAVLCRQINFKDYERRAYEYLSHCYERSGDFKAALQYQIAFTRINDSLFNETRSKQISELQISYETEKKESEIQGLRHRQQINNYVLTTTVIFSLMIVVGGLVVYRQQKSKNRLSQERAVKETEENERLRIAKDIHDELGSGLSKIHFLSQELLYKRHSDETKTTMNSVIEISRDLIDNMRDLVWELNTENTSLDGLIARIREYSSDYLEDTPIRLVGSYSTDIPDIALGKIVYRNIFMTVKEALNNSVKHSGASHAYITVNISNGKLVITIRDDGKGFIERPRGEGNGLMNMKSRIRSIGGMFHIQSSAAGTEVVLEFPFDRKQQV